MGKKLIMFGCIAAIVMMLGNRAVALEIKVDIARVGYPSTEKPGWTIWSPYNDEDRHDKTLLANVDGTGVDIWASASHDGDLAGWYDSTPGVEPICNTGFWIFNYKEMDIYLAFIGLDPGEYTLTTYHRHPDGLNPMQAIEVTDCNLGWLGGDPCSVGGVTQIPTGEGNDVNVPIPGDPTIDANLPGSVVKFVTDGTPVLVIYRRPSDGVPVINAFILSGEAGPTAAGPTPAHDGTLICPDTELSWIAGRYAASHDVYVGTDWDDVNDATTALDPNNVFVGNQPLEDTNYSPPGLLDFGQTYHWRVDEVNDACEPYLWKGIVWSFAVEDGKARDPYPSDGAGSLSTDAKILSWTGSCIATSHDVYFGQDFNDVNDATTASAPFQVNQPGTTWSTPTLDLGKRYYWRIDEHTSLGVVKGDVWDFQTLGYPVMYLPLDGVRDANLTGPYSDWTGNVTFQVDGQISYDEANPLYNTGGTSAFFDQTEGSTGLFRNDVPGAEIMDLAGSAYTIEMWVNQQRQSVGDDDEDDFAATLIRRYDLSYVLAIGEDGAVRYVHGGYDVGDNDPQQTVVESAPGRIGLGEWHHIAAVFDSTAIGQQEKLYIDGLLEADSNYPGLNPTSDDDPLAIGMRVNPFRVGPRRIRNRFHGLIDELRIVDLALTPDEFLLRGDPNLAWLPRPGDHARDVPPDATVFEWNPGEPATSHDVYFGTSFDDVSDADTTSSVYQGNRGPNDFDPGRMKLETTYFWRVDEVNDTDPNIWKGNVWRFTTANYIIVDDFESYASDNDMYTKWLDGWNNDTGSTLLLSASGDPTHGGDKSQLYSYNNMGSPYYSEAERVLSPAQNWSTELRLAQLFFYGKSTNSAGSTEQLHLIFKDSGGASAGAAYGDQEGESMSDVQVEDWHEWKIPLSTFSGGMSLGSVASVFINFGQSGGSTGGTGLVFFDDIRVAGPMCVPSEGPEYDFSGNCIVDIADVGVMGEEWLKTDVNFSDLGITVTEPSTTNLVGFWKLEGNGNDSSGKGNNGTPEGTYSWVTGYDEVNQAIEFDEGRVLVPDHATLRPESVVSAACWVYYDDDPGDSARVVVKGPDNFEAYCLELGGAYEFTFYVGEPNGTRYFADANEGDVRPGEWMHLGGTYDGTTVKSYVNGLVVGTEANSISLSQDPNGLAIGNRPDANDKPYAGIVDEVRVYSAALSQAEMAWLATDGTGYVPLRSMVNIYDEEPQGSRAINFRDVAELMTKWLEKKLWPPEP